MAKCSSQPSSIRRLFGHYPWFSELQSLSCIDENAFAIELQAGAINQNYQLVSGTQQYFLKVFSDTEVMVNRLQQCQLMEWLTQHQLTPNTIYLSQGNHFQLDVWVSHQTPKSETDKLEWLTTALVTLHQLPVLQEYPDCPRLNLPEIWHQYIDASELPLTPEMEKRLKEGEAYWREQTPTVLGHHDLHIEHLLSNQPLCIIDFEYAALSTEAFDLASTVAINQFDSRQQYQLCEYYSIATNRKKESVYREMLDAMPWVNLTHELWQHLIQKRQ